MVLYLMGEGAGRQPCGVEIRNCPNIGMRSMPGTPMTARRGRGRGDTVFALKNAEASVFRQQEIETEFAKPTWNDWVDSFTASGRPNGSGSKRPKCS